MIVYMTKVGQKTLILGLFLWTEHYKMMFIITMQYALGIPPNLRTNIDYVFILREIMYQIGRDYMKLWYVPNL